MLKLSLLSRLRPRSGYDVVAVIAMFAAFGTGVPTPPPGPWKFDIQATCAKVG